MKRLINTFESLLKATLLYNFLLIMPIILLFICLASYFLLNSSKFSKLTNIFEEKAKRKRKEKTTFCIKFPNNKTTQLDKSNYKKSISSYLDKATDALSKQLDRTKNYLPTNSRTKPEDKKSTYHHISNMSVYNLTSEDDCAKVAVNPLTSKCISYKNEFDCDSNFSDCLSLQTHNMVSKNDFESGSVWTTETCLRSKYFPVLPGEPIEQCQRSDVSDKSSIKSDDNSVTSLFHRDSFCSVDASFQTGLLEVDFGSSESMTDGFDDQSVEMKLLGEFLNLEIDENSRRN